MVLWGMIIFGIVLMLSFVGKKHEETVCVEFELSIQNESDDALTSAPELRELIIKTTDSLVGKRLGEIDHYHIHRVLKSNPYIRSSRVQTSLDGKLMVGVTLREPIVRIIGMEGGSCYIDQDGWIMPVNPGFPARVLIANGYISDDVNKLKDKAIHIDSLQESAEIRNIYRLAGQIGGHPFLQRLVSQVWLTEGGELELIPLVGEYTILFGDFSDMEEKFSKLIAYYQEGAGKAGWIDYKSIDLRYKNQVICSK